MIGLAALLAGLAVPGAVEAERAFAASAQTDGQWTAFRTYAATDAVMFTPQPVNAQQWLAGRSDPAQAVMWWPASSFVSCDGTVAVNTGPWLRNGGKLAGYFTTVWRKQQDGGWKWLLDHGDGLAAPRAAGEPVRAKQASCEGKPPPVPAQAGSGSGHGASDDNSLAWTWDVASDGARRFSASLWNGNRHEIVIEDRVQGQP